MAKMTVHEILTAINDIRKLTSPSPPQLGSIPLADSKLLDLQERLLDDYGDEPQSTKPE